MSKISYLIAAVAATTLVYSCGQGGGNAPEVLSSITDPVGGVPQIPTDGTSYFALVYGSTASDRQLLSDRIAGYQAPGLSEVFNNWRRIAGNNIYNTPADIPQNPAYCSSTGFNADKNWNPAVNPANGQTIQPGTHTECINSNSFVSLSWSYKNNPDRLYNAANGSSFNGFISGIKFTNYTLEATLSSVDSDDDGIGIIIAAYVDGSNNIHTLTAMRTQGGFPPPSVGWGLVYRTNNTVVSEHGSKAVGTLSGGWNGRRTKIRVERSGDQIKAYTSPFVTSGTTPVIDSNSEITLDLSTTAGLSGFRGEQYYGYGTISQLGATFEDISFSTPNAESDPAYIYDLLNNLVYNKMAGGGYVVVPGMSAYETIGYPKRVKNTESSKEFMINSGSSYTEL